MELIFLKNKKIYFYTLLTLSVFLLSFLGFVYPAINYISFWTAVLTTAYLAFKKLEFGVLIAVYELIIGSKGYIFSFPIFNYVVSLRLAIFLIVFSAYIFRLIKKREIHFFHSKIWLSFLIFCIFLGYGLVNGLIKNPNTIVFYDINAYFYLALIFPFFEVFSQKENIKRFVKILTIGVFSLAIFTLLILIDFGIFEYSDELISATKVESKQLEELENLSTLPENARLAQTTNLAKEKMSLDESDLTEDKPAVYRWLKDLGLAEVSYIGGRFFRVFSASHFYLVVYLIFLIIISVFKKFNLTGKILNFSIIFIFCFVLIVSFSRSLWLGFFAGFLFLLFSLPRKKIFQVLSFTLLMLIITVLIVYFILPSSFDLIISRLTSLFEPSSELAASNRMSLLNPILDKIRENPLLGSGFGTLVTFKSLVPGTEYVEYIKVYLYEWAYLDIMVKIGILGLFSYLYFIYVIFKSGYHVHKRIKNDIDNYILVKSLLAGLILLMFTHFTTPYLNHPLGIGYILIIAPIFYSYLIDSNERQKIIN